MNKKLPRLFKSNTKLFFLLIAIFAILTFFLWRQSQIIAVAEVVVLFILIVYSRLAQKRRTQGLLNYIVSMSDGMDLTVRNTPLPVAVYNSETNEIIWSNDRFVSITGMKAPVYGITIIDAVPEYSGDWMLEGKSECPKPVRLGDRTYLVFGSIVSTERDYIATTYWVDVTEYENTKNEYLDTRLVFAILTIDNFDELIKGASEKEKSVILSDIDDSIRAWIGGNGGYLCRYDRDHYFLISEERDLFEYTKDNFSVLDHVRALTGMGGVRATLSIGIGKDGASPMENYRFASLGVEMALSRGGDQAVIRNKYGFEFFGGHSPQVENRTQVRIRVMASAFGELLNDASGVFIMGHRVADYDSIGAAAGVCCIARAKGKQARIVIDMKDNIAKNLVELLEENKEYEDVFISADDAIIEADSKSLLIVVDTSKPEIIESESLLMSFMRIAVIDHHSRGADYIENAVLNICEPNASSAAELVTEIMRHLIEKSDILQGEAEALMAGIVLDTKGFVINTGSRTFDAAAYLKNAGAESVVVKRLMQTDIDTAVGKYSMLQNAVKYKEGIAITSSDRLQHRISVAQAADEMLNLEEVTCSFAIGNDGECIYVSARSVGTVNVQLILERLGGGGNQSMAGLQVYGSSVEHVVEDIERAIDEYVKDNRGRKERSNRRK